MRHTSSRFLSAAVSGVAFVALSGLFFASSSIAQVVGQNASPDQPQTFTLNVRSQMVVETVNVTDKQGKPIQGLTANDFTVTEDGVPQKVRYCEYQTLPSDTLPEPPQPTAEQNITIYRTLNRSQIAPETTGSNKYKDHRLLAMYFDMSSMPPGDQLRALDAAQKFIRTQITSVDLVSILRYSGGSVDVLQDFTADRTRLLSILETMVVGEGQGEVDSIQDASASDTGAAFGQDDSEFNIFNTDRQLSALQTAANMLAQISEKKALVYFASGLRLNGLDNQAQLKATEDAAVRAGVSFWPIDARGLVAQAPLGDATKGSPGNQGMYSGTAALAVTSNFQQSQDTLYALAGDTGGKALLDFNDLTRGIVDAQKSVTSYYVLEYYTTNSTLDGKFRKIKITLNDANAKLDYRQGYYAGKEFAKFTTVDKERQLEDALMLPDPVTELTIAMEINYFQLNRAEYFVPLVVKIPGRELALAKKGGAEHTLIDFVGEIKDSVGGMTVTNLRDNVNIKLSDQNAADLAKKPIEYDAGFTLLPGKYTIKFLARDDETGRIGTFQATFTIPNLNKEVKRVPTSSVVLSSQRVEMRDALYNATKAAKDQEKDAAANPLIQDGRKLVPSVTRVFTKGRDLYVYLQAYEQGATAPKPMVAYVTFYKDAAKVFETKPTAVTPATLSRLGTTPLNFSIPMEQLQTGRYDCQVTIVDPTDGKATFWQAPIVLIP